MTLSSLLTEVRLSCSPLPLEVLDRIISAPFSLFEALRVAAKLLSPSKLITGNAFAAEDIYVAFLIEMEGF